MTISSVLPGHRVPLSFGQLAVRRSEIQIGAGHFNQHLNVLLPVPGADAGTRSRRAARDLVPVLLRMLQERNDAFRACLVETSAGPCWEFRPLEAVAPIDILPSDAPFDEWRWRSFAEGEVSLARAGVTDDDNGLRLDLVMDHLAFDGWSLGLLTKEIAQIWQFLQDGSAVTRRNGSFQAYLSRLAAQRTPQAVEKYRAYWEAEFGHDAELTLAPRDGEGWYRMEFDVPGDVSERFPAMRKALKTTDFGIFLAALTTVLVRRTGQSSLLIGSAIADRSTAEALETMGCLQNGVGIRVDVAETFAQTVRSCLTGLMSAVRYQDGPFYEVAVHRPGATVFAQPRLYEGDSWQPRSAPGPESWPIETIPPAPGDITFEFRQAPWGHAGALAWSGAYFDARGIRHVASELLELLARVSHEV